MQVELSVCCALLSCKLLRSLQAFWQVNMLHTPQECNVHILQWTAVSIQSTQEEEKCVQVNQNQCFATINISYSQNIVCLDSDMRWQVKPCLEK